MDEYPIPSAPPISRENTTEFTVECKYTEAKAIVSRPRNAKVIMRELKAMHYLNKLVQKTCDFACGDLYFNCYFELLESHAYNYMLTPEMHTPMNKYISSIKKYASIYERYPVLYGERHVGGEYIRDMMSFKNEHVLSMIDNVINQILLVIKDF